MARDLKHQIERNLWKYLDHVLWMAVMDTLMPTMHSQILELGLISPAPSQFGMDED